MISRMSRRSASIGARRAARQRVSPSRRRTWRSASCTCSSRGGSTRSVAPMPLDDANASWRFNSQKGPKSSTQSRRTIRPESRPIGTVVSLTVAIGLDSGRIVRLDCVDDFGPFWELNRQLAFASSNGIGATDLVEPPRLEQVHEADLHVRRRLGLTLCLAARLAPIDAERRDILLIMCDAKFPDSSDQHTNAAYVVADRRVAWKLGIGPDLDPHFRIRREVSEFLG